MCVNRALQVQHSGDGRERSPRLAQGESLGVQLGGRLSLSTRGSAPLGFGCRSPLGSGGVGVPRHRPAPSAPQWGRSHMGRCQELRSNQANSGDLERATSAECRRRRHPISSATAPDPGVLISSLVTQRPIADRRGRTTRPAQGMRSLPGSTQWSTASLRPHRPGSPESSVANPARSKGAPNRRDHRRRSPKPLEQAPRIQHRQADWAGTWA